MKYGIWIDQKTGVGMLAKVFTDEELVALKEAGMDLKCEHRFKAESKKRAQEVFISWIKTFKQPDAKVKYVDFAAAGLRPKGD